ncbi:MAG: transposase DNA-binding-containing protein [Leptospirales bacterium]
MRRRESLRKTGLIFPRPVDWTEEEFRRVSLPNKRLSDCLLAMGRAVFGRPTAQLPQDCGSRAETKAA